MKVAHSTRIAPAITRYVPASLWVAALFFALGAIPAQAGSRYYDPSVSNYSGPGPTIISLTKLKEMAENETVAIRGSLIQSLGETDYLFEDATGTVVVQIDRMAWNGQKITHTDAVEIQGKIRKKRSGVQVEARRIVLLKEK